MYGALLQTLNHALAKSVLFLSSGDVSLRYKTREANQVSGLLAAVPLPAPRHADLLLVTGPMVRAFEVAARKTYEAMPGPKVVVATGACALGGVYRPDPFVHGQVSAVLPVDVWIPGCPPSPLALLHGLSVAVGRLAEKTPGLTFIAGEDHPGGDA